MASSAQQASSEEQATATQFDDVNLEIDDREDTDSAYASSVNSETTSIASQYKGYFENGRRYQNVKAEDYYQPTDEKQWESLQAGHMLMLILESQRANPHFRSPLSSKAQHIIDLGTGHGDWALDIADKFPQTTVHGVDLFPPPQPLTAPNCVFEVDDVTKPWTWSHKFDLVHIRYLQGAFSNSEWETLYGHCFDNVVPGGWIEQVEFAVEIFSMDNSLTSDSVLYDWGNMWDVISEAAGRPFNAHAHMEERMKAAGFTNIQRQEYKVPIGTWPKLEVYKDAGRVNKSQVLQGIEGWTLFLLTKYGQPTPWSVEEVQVWLAKVRAEINAGGRLYQKYYRCWGQKPLDAAADNKLSPEAELEKLPSKSPSPKHQPAKKQKVSDDKGAEEA